MIRDIWLPNECWPLTLDAVDADSLGRARDRTAGQTLSLLILPDGQISKILSSPLCKNIPLSV